MPPRSARDAGGGVRSATRSWWLYTLFTLWRYTGPREDKPQLAQCHLHLLFEYKMFVVCMLLFTRQQPRAPSFFIFAFLMGARIFIWRTRMSTFAPRISWIVDKNRASWRWGFTDCELFNDGYELKGNLDNRLGDIFTLVYATWSI